MKNCLRALFIFCSVISTFAKTPPIIAEVISVRGVVTKLLPHTLEATPAKVGDKLPLDSSIFTRKKSIVKLKFIDNSKMTLRPKSKIVLKRKLLESRKVNLTSLLVGKIRVYVEKKSKQERVKFLIKTRTVSLGVRGTEFDASYFPKTERTSLLTYEGEVEASKLDLVGTKSKSVAKVGRGKFLSIDSTSTKKTTSLFKRPVTISKNQFEALKNHDPLSDLKESKPIQSKVVNNLDGGLVDINTGHYIPPTVVKVGSNVVKKTLIGSFKPEDGSYVPPKGLALDEEKGFVLASKDKDVTPKEVENLNKKLALEKIEKKDSLSNKLKVQMELISQKINVEKKDSSNFFGQTHSKNGSRASLTYTHGLSSSLEVSVKLGVTRIEYDPSMSAEQVFEDKFYYNAGVGFNFQLLENWNLRTLASLEEKTFLDQGFFSSSFQRIYYRKVLIPKIRVSLLYNLKSYNLENLYFEAGVIASKGRQKEHIHVEEGLGVSGKIHYVINKSKNHELKTHIFYENETQDTSEFNHRRKELGVGVSYSFF